jgi:hypothetical protein
LRNSATASSAIEQHRAADAAYDDALERGADEAIKDARQQREGKTLIALLQTQPTTLAGCLAVLRYVANWTENNDAALFDGWSDPHRSAAAAFLPMIAATIEAIASTVPGDCNQSHLWPNNPRRRRLDNGLRQGLHR